MSIDGLHGPNTTLSKYIDPIATGPNHAAGRGYLQKAAALPQQNTRAQLHPQTAPELRSPAKATKLQAIKKIFKELKKRISSESRNMRTPLQTNDKHNMNATKAKNNPHVSKTVAQQPRPPKAIPRQPPIFIPKAPVVNPILFQNTVFPEAALNLTPPLPTANFAQNVIKDDFAVLSILKLHLPTNKTMTQANFMQAVQATHHFLHNNGARGNELSNRLTMIDQHLRHRPQLIRSLQGNSAIEITKLLNQNNLKNFSLNINHVIPNPSRIDKRTTGLAHTIIQTPDHQLFELLKSYDLKNSHDYDAMAQVHQHLLAPQGKTRTTGLATYNSIIGKGSFGKVIPARNILTHEIYAGKKILNLPSAEKEFTVGQQLAKSLPANTRQDFIIAAHHIATVGAPQKQSMTKVISPPVAKAYVFSPLAIKNDEFSQMEANLHFRYSNDQKGFEYHNFRQLSLFTHLVSQLEANNIVHPDLKPENIFGERIGDVGDIIKENGKIRAQTAPYTMPSALKSPDQLSGLDFKTFNRYSLGVMIFQSITGQFPTNPDLPPELKLPANGQFAAKGFDSRTLNIIPLKLNGGTLTPYDRVALQFAKRLMADDRQYASPNNMNLQKWMAKLESQKAY